MSLAIKPNDFNALQFQKIDDNGVTYYYPDDVTMYENMRERLIRNELQRAMNQYFTSSVSNANKKFICEKFNDRIRCYDQILKTRSDTWTEEQKRKYEEWKQEKKQERDERKEKQVSTRLKRQIGKSMQNTKTKITNRFKKKDTVQDDSSTEDQTGDMDTEEQTSDTVTGEQTSDTDSPSSDTPPKKPNRFVNMFKKNTSPTVDKPSSTSVGSKFMSVLRKKTPTQTPVDTQTQQTQTPSSLDSTTSPMDSATEPATQTTEQDASSTLKLKQGMSLVQNAMKMNPKKTPTQNPVDTQTQTPSPVDSTTEPATQTTEQDATSTPKLKQKASLIQNALKFKPKTKVDIDDTDTRTKQEVQQELNAFGKEYVCYYIPKNYKQKRKHHKKYKHICDCSKVWY